MHEDWKHVTCRLEQWKPNIPWQKCLRSLSQFYYKTKNVQQPRCLHYGAQLGLYTLIGSWYAFSGGCGRGGTIGHGAVSWRTTSTCRRLRRRVCAGNSSPCASPATTKLVSPEMVPASSSSAVGKGLVGGVKNSSSPELSPMGPMTSGHLRSHLQTADRTRFTS